MIWNDDVPVAGLTGHERVVVHERVGSGTLVAKSLRLGFEPVVVPVNYAIVNGRSVPASFTLHGFGKLEKCSDALARADGAGRTDGLYA